MELPTALRRAVDAALSGVPRNDLAAASAKLSQRYRAELRDGRLHLADARAATAYLATRLPATYAAIRAAMTAMAEQRPDFAPASLLDFGAGPGTALWAARDAWPELGDATLVEASAAIRGFGEGFAAALDPINVAWRAGLDDAASGDLVTLCYVLDELEPAARGPLIARLWSRTADTLLIVEPGTSAGWRRVLEARGHLIAAGAHLIAPCPHARECPLIAPDWCHFSRRVSRAKSHREAKGAEVPWEDEKFIYLAVSRRPTASPAARIIAPPRKGSGKVELKLCREDGIAETQLITRRDGDRFKRARRADWGDSL
jgi:ribosomal protein RSM22 (predicted rRNA methylase)